MTKAIGYVVVESDGKGVKKDLSHWFFKSYSNAIQFAEQMRDNNSDNMDDFQFDVVAIIDGDKVGS